MQKKKKERKGERGRERERERERNVPQENDSFRFWFNFLQFESDDVLRLAIDNLS